jgi:hypothetical protein
MIAPGEAAMREAAVRFALGHAGGGSGAGGLRASVEAVRSDGDCTRVRVAVAAPLSTYLARYNARTGESLGWIFELLMAGLDQGGVPESECLLAARAAADVPEDAVLVRCGYADVGGLPVFEAVWRHEHEGLAVEGDAITVQVNGRTGRPYALVRRWHGVDEEAGER